MPKQRITREMVVDTAFEIARKDGMNKVTVKNIAEKLNCSVQPIYSYCQNMDGLRRAIGEKARNFVREYVKNALDKNDLFRSTGHAYIAIAKEEPQIFRLYLFQKRENISSLEDLYCSETNPAVAEMIAEDLHISLEEARKLHLNMLIYTIGLGTIFSITSATISEEEIYHQQELAYQIFLKKILEGK